MVAVLDEEKADQLGAKIQGPSPEILWGEKGFIRAAQWESTDLVLLSMVGAAGLKPALAAIDAGKQIALANKRDPGDGRRYRHGPGP